MPMPHRTFAQVAEAPPRGRKDRSASRDQACSRSCRTTATARTPTCGSGYEELDRTRVRAKVTHRDSLQVRREGAAQIALVGPPNAGKSSLLQALSEIQIRTGDYAFTTLRPVPALTRIGGVLVQLVEIPGLIEGAHEDRGGGRALLGVLRNADAIVYCQAAPRRSTSYESSGARSRPPASRSRRSSPRRRPTSAGGRRGAARGRGGAVEVVPVSVLDDASLDRLRRRSGRLPG